MDFLSGERKYNDNSHLFSPEPNDEDVALEVSYPNVGWLSDHLFPQPAYRQRQIGPGHVGILLFDSENAPDVGIGDNATIAGFDVRLRNGEYGDDDRMRMKVSKMNLNLDVIYSK